MNDSVWVRRMQAEMGLPKPLLKWMGNKCQLLPWLLPRMPEKWNRYFEPFAGGLSVFFALYRDERIDAATLGDANFDLMDTYRVVRRYPDLVMQTLQGWKPSRAKFAELCLVRRTSQWTPEDAARFIYLNQTCRNGLYQVNQHGEFAVPFGKHKNPEIYDEENVEAVSAALRTVVLYTGSFEGCLREVARGDFVYCDPPCGAEFGPRDQKKLACVLDGLNRAGVKWMLSSSDVEWVCRRYKKYCINRISTGNGVIVRNY